MDCPLCDKSTAKGTIWTHPRTGRKFHVSCIAEYTAGAHRFDEAEYLLVEAGFEFGELALMKAGCAEGYVPARTDVEGPWNPGPLAQRLARVRHDHADTLQAFHTAFHDAGCTWTTTRYMGRLIKWAPSDLWALQEVLVGLKPSHVMIVGLTFALADWCQTVLDKLAVSYGGPAAFVFEPLDPSAIKNIVRPPTMLIVSGDYLEDTVYAALASYGGYVDYIVVEHTNVSWGDIPTLKGDGGARGAVAKYLSEHPGEWEQDQSPERFLVTLNPGGWLKRVGRKVESNA